MDTIDTEELIKVSLVCKGTYYGMYSRYKAELHLDGRQIALD